MGMMRPLDKVLERLDGVRQVGDGCYEGSCPHPEHGKRRGDVRPSLSVSEGDDGRALLNCHANCPTEEILAAIDLSMSDLFEQREGNGSNSAREIVEIYDYTDETGMLLFQSVRFEPKCFSQRRPDGNGGWIYKGIFKNGTGPVLYRLPRVVEAVREGRTIFVVEGEKDVHRLEREGLTATTNPMGAGKWREGFSDTLAGADVKIIPDNDRPGRKHARQVARSLRGKARNVQIVELPGLPVGDDVCDFFDEGGTGEQLQSLPSSPSSSYRDSDGDDGGTRPVEGLQLTSFASVPRPPDERPMVIERMIPQGFPALIYGEGATAKSLLAASASLDVARGAEEWMGFKIMQHGPAILLDFELDLQEQARRVYQLAEGLGLDKPPDGFYYLSGADYPPGAVLTRTLQLANEIGAVLVVLDSLGFALEGDMEASRDVLRFIRNHVLPFKTAGVTPLIVDHQAKLQGGEGYHQKSPFGSVYKSNACRSVMQVGVEDQREGELTVRFRHKKSTFGSKFDPFEAQLLFHATRVEIRHRALSAEDAATEGSLNTKQKIRRLLREGPMFPEELEEKIDAKLGTIKNKLTELRRDDGEVEYTGVVSDTGARQVRLVQAPSSPSQRHRDGDGDDGPQVGRGPEVVTRTPTGTAPLPTDEWEEV
jgi:hypothetical protein